MSLLGKPRHLNFKPQSTLKLKSRGPDFSPMVTFLLEPQCALQLTLLLLRSKPGRAFIFSLISTSIFFSHKETLFHLFCHPFHYLKHHSFLQRTPPNPIFKLKYPDTKEIHLTAHSTSHLKDSPSSSGVVPRQLNTVSCGAALSPPVRLSRPLLC